MAHSPGETYGTGSPQGMDHIPQYRGFYDDVSPMSPSDAKEVAAPQAGSHAGANQPKIIFGVPRSSFVLSLLLILVIIIAAVAGGVGGSVAVNNAYDRGKADAAAEGVFSGATGDTSGDSSGGSAETEAEATATAESDNSGESRVKTPPTKGLLELDCPDLSDTTHKIKLADTTYNFKAHCGINHPAAKGGTDMMVLPAYSFHDCITACASFNKFSTVKDKTCVTAHFNANLRTEEGGNCWLKSKVGDEEVNNNEDTKDYQIEGELIQ